MLLFSLWGSSFSYAQEQCVNWSSLYRAADSLEICGPCLEEKIEEGKKNYEYRKQKNCLTNFSRRNMRGLDTSTLDCTPETYNESQIAAFDSSDKLFECLGSLTSIKEITEEFWTTPVQSNTSQWQQESPSENTDQPSSSQWKECKTCGSPAAQLRIMEAFIQDILLMIQTFGDNDNQLGAYTNPNLPSWPLQQWIVGLNEDRRNVLQAWVDTSARAANQLAQSAQVTATILATDVYDLIRKDTFGWLAILTQTEAIVRDRAIMQQLDSYIQDKQFEMWLAAMYDSNITPEDYQRLSQIIAEYNTIQWVPFQATITSNTRYSNIIMMSRRMVSATKRFLSVGSTQQYGNNDFTRGWFSVIFDMEEIQDMATAYKCARFGDTCAGDLKTFVDNIENIGQDTIQWAKQSVNTITEAAKRLKMAFSVPFKKADNLTPEEKEFLSKEEQLLRTVYGSDTARIINGWFGGRKEAAEEWKKSLQNLKDFANNTKATVSQKLATIEANKKELQEMSQKTRWENDRKREEITQQITTDFQAFITQSNANTQAQENTKDIVDATFVFVEQEHMAARTIFTIADTSPITIYYPLLAAQLDRIATIIGSKDNKWSIIENLWRSCELQCSNHSGRCWY